MISKALYARLTGFAGLSALIGDRAYPDEADQGVTLPYIVYEEFDGERYSAMGSDGDLNDARVRLHCWGATKDSAMQVREQVRLALQRFRGTVGGVVVDDIFIISGGTTLRDPTTRHWQAIRDFRVIARE